MYFCKIQGKHRSRNYRFLRILCLNVLNVNIILLSMNSLISNYFINLHSGEYSIWKTEVISYKIHR